MTNPALSLTKQRTRVAILSSHGFGATTVIDRKTLSFGRTGYEASLDVCNGTEDANGDGLVDLVCQFTTAVTALEFGDTEAVLRGETGDGVLFVGTASIGVVP